VLDVVDGIHQFGLRVAGTNAFIVTPLYDDKDVVIDGGRDDFLNMRPPRLDLPSPRQSNNLNHNQSPVKHVVEINKGPSPAWIETTVPGEGAP
jgi:hypothetical protein